jgi:hypothetical protein
MIVREGAIATANGTGLATVSGAATMRIVGTMTTMCIVEGILGITIGIVEVMTMMIGIVEVMMMMIGIVEVMMTDGERDAIIDDVSS